MEILVARQPVFDRHERLYGYDLLLKQAGPGGAADGCPEELFVNAILGLGLDRLAGSARAFVTVDRAMLEEGSVQLLPADRVVAQLVGETAQDDRVIESCDALLWKGYRIALAPKHPWQVPDRLLRAADVVKVDVASTDPAELAEIARWLRGFQVRLLATNARHRAERDQCTRLGFELFQGYRFSAPETVSRQDLPVQHVLTFRVLKLVRDQNTSDLEIEGLLRRDVALSYKLLRMVNSAAFGGRGIWSIGHALRLLGREQVGRWLALLLVTDTGREGVRAELMHQALVRGRLCELLAAASGIPRAAGSLFLVGILSPLDQLLETPMETLVAQMELAPDVSEALLHREDFYGAVLSLVEAYEMGWWDEVDTCAATVGVAPHVLGSLYLDALGWASEQRRPAELDTPPRPIVRTVVTGQPRRYSQARAVPR